MVDGQQWNLRVREKMEAAHGYYEIGMYADAWTVLDELPTEDKSHPLVALLQLDILLEMDRWGEAVALGTDASRQWPVLDEFFIKTAAAYLELSDFQKAKDLLLAGPESLQQKALYWYRLACCQCRTGEIDEAKKSIAECFERDEVLRGRALYDCNLEGIWEAL